MKIEGLSNALQAGGSTTSLLDRLQPGDTVRALIIDMKMGELVLRLGDGSTVKAAALTAVQARTGDFADFVIREKQDGKILLETVKVQVPARSAAQKEEPVEQMLREMDVEPDTQARETAKSILDGGVKLTKDAFDTIRRLVSSFEGLTPEKAVFMLANGIQFAEKNVFLVNRLTAGKMQVGNQLLELGTLLEGIDDPALIGRILTDLEALEDPLGSPGKSGGGSQAAESSGYRQKLAANTAIEENIPIPREQGAREIIRKLFVPVESEYLNEELEPQLFLKQLSEKLEVVREHIAYAALPGKEKVLGLLQDIGDSQQFFQELSRHQCYYQIPLRFGEMNTTGELFIMKRKGGQKNLNADDLTAYVALDTQNLGNVEAMISLSQKNLRIHFRVKREEIVQLVKEHSTQLYKTFSDAGYKLVECSCKQAETKTDLVNVAKALIQQDSPEYFAFDKRV